MIRACLAKAQTRMNTIMRGPSDLLKINIVRMKTIFIFFTFLTAFLISSCKKDPDMVKVNGTVIENYVGGAISGASIVLQGKGVNTGIYSTGFSDLASTTSDASGSFSLEFEKKPYSEYRFIISKPNYFSEFVNVASTAIDGSSYNGQLKLSAIATLHFVIKNINPVSGEDYINLVITQQPASCSDCCTTSQINLPGMAVDTSFYCTTHGNHSIILMKTIKHGGSQVISVDTIAAQAFQTQEVIINY